MENFIKWQDCDKWVRSPSLTEKDYPEEHITRELVCDHPEVERVWCFGYFADETRTNMAIGMEIMLKNGERKSFYKVDPDQYNSGDFAEAENYLQNLPQN